MKVRAYNYPWAGRIGRVQDCCPYCGDSGMPWKMSSTGRCLSEDCRLKYDKPNPEHIERFKVKAQSLIQKWCDERNIDYEATVKKYLDVLGPPLVEQGTITPEEQDCIVYKVKK